MPTNAPLIKKEATENYGAKVISVDGVYDDAAREANRLSKENGYVFIHPFDDPYIIAGQGTLGIEIIEQMPDVEQVIVPIGGGGLISGLYNSDYEDVNKSDNKRNNLSIISLVITNDMIPILNKAQLIGKISIVPCNYPYEYKTMSINKEGEIMNYLN